MTASFATAALLFLVFSTIPLSAQQAPATVDWDTTFAVAGPDGPVNAVAMVGDDIYVGGRFRTAGRVAALNIARWNRVERRWYALDVGLWMLDSSWRRDSALHKSEVHEIVVVGEDIYIGGEFERAGDDLAVFGVARWNTRTKRWYALEGSIPPELTICTVRALAVDGDRVFAGGSFGAEYEFVTGLLEYDRASGRWTIPDPELKDTIRTLAIDDTYLYAGFSGAPGGSRLTGGLKRLHLGSRIWSTMGDGVTYFDYPNYKARPIVETIRVVGDWVFVGGRYFIPGVNGGEDTTSNSIARWSRSRQKWEKTGLGPTYSHSDNDTLIAVRDLAVHDGYLYIAGDFDSDWRGDNGVARWSLERGGEWEFLGDRQTGVRAISAGDAGIYIGGRFETYDTLPNARVARLDPATRRWLPLDEPGNLGVIGTVRAMTAYEGKVYVGGDIRAIGSTTVGGIAEIDTATGAVSTMAGGVDGAVRSLHVHDGGLYVGGTFRSAGGIAANRIARWDLLAKRWDSVGGGVGNRAVAYGDTVRALAADTDYLYAGGDFQTVDGRYIGSVVRYSFAARRWDSMGRATSQPVHVLAFYNGELHAGGPFRAIGNWTAPGIARWDGARWFPVGEGFRGRVHALATYRGALYVGGEGIQLPGFTQDVGLVRWDGTTWARPDSALIADVTGLHTAGNHLYAVGTRWFGIGRSTPERVFRWDGSRWSGLGRGIGIYSDRLHAVTSEGGSIWVGGYLHFLDGTYYWQRNRPGHGISRWRPWLAEPVSRVPSSTPGRPIVSVTPNPSSGPITFRLGGTVSAPLSLTIVDLLGSTIATIDGSGAEAIVWDPAGVAAGVYIYRLRSSVGEASGIVTIDR